MAAIRVWTLEELNSLPDDGNTYELVHGELFVTPPPGTRHEGVAGRLTHALVPYVIAQRLGMVYHPEGVVQHEGSQVEPDLMVRQALKFDAPWDEQPVPILAIEILSPSNRRVHMAAKRAFYAEAGVGEYWIVDPARQTITSVRAGRADVESAEILTWHPAGATAPLVVDVAELFAEKSGTG